MAVDTPNEKREKIVKLAKGLIGIPYKYGARIDEAPNYFDCSLFLQYLYKQIGVDIPRATIDQAEFAGIEVKDIKDMQVGDIIFLRGPRGHYNPRFPEGIGHAAIYTGDGKVIHAESERIQGNPTIIEKGEVKEQSLEDILKRLGPPVIIKRILT